MKLITAPTAEPLVLADVKTRLSIKDTEDDSDITAYIQAAREQAESYMDRSIITQTWELALDGFSNEIELPKGPVQSITSVKYYDTDDVEQTVNSADYVLNDYDELKPVLIEAKDSDWPATNGFTNNVKVRYVTGWGDAADVPEDVKTAMLLAIGHWIRFQAVAESGIPTRMPRQFYDLLQRHRVVKL